jgi:hypothetical protein
VQSLHDLRHDFLEQVFGVLIVRTLTMHIDGKGQASTQSYSGFGNGIGRKDFLEVLPSIRVATGLKIR